MKDNIFIILLISLFLLSGCSKNNAPLIEKKETKDSSSVTANVNKESAGAETKENADGTISGLKYDVKDIAGKLLFDGNIVAGAQWKDSKGLNAIIITETRETEKKRQGGERTLSKKLFGYGFLIGENGNSEEVWKINDLVENCDFDLTLSYIEKSLSVTDLNKNGIAETTFLYKLTCRSDVSPSDLKLMMHEGKEKYAIRGTMIVKLPNEGPYGGEMKVDKSFNDSPKEFLDYAKQQWKKFQEEKFN